MDLIALMIFFGVSLVGCTLIISDSKLMAPLRDWIRNKNVPFIFGHKLVDMMECPQCCGTWVGIFGFWVAFPFIPIHWTYWQMIMLFPVCILSGAACSVLAVLTRALQDWLTLNISIPEGIFDEAIDKK